MIKNSNTRLRRTIILEVARENTLNALHKEHPGKHRRRQQALSFTYL